jgi:hypothetical protein
MIFGKWQFANVNTTREYLPTPDDSKMLGWAHE